MLYYALAIIFIGVGFLYFFNQNDIQKSTPTNNLDKTMSKSVDSEQKEQIKISQEMILPHRASKRSIKIWKKIQKVGFNSPKILSLLKELFDANGEFKYYKELKDAAIDNKLSDEVTAYIVYMLSTAYESDMQDIYSYGLTPKDEKDRVIQELILNQLKNPAGKESYKNALKNLDLVMLDKDAQEIYDELLQSDQDDISHKEIYEMKIKNVSMAGYPDSFIDVIDSMEKNIEKFDKSEQKELVWALTQAGQTVPWREDKDLKDRYVKYIQDTMPKKLINEYVDDEIVGEELLQKYDITESYYDSLSKKEQKKLRDKLEKEANKKIEELTEDNNHDQLARSINAICSASITHEVDFYQACKDLFLDSENLDYKYMTIKSMFNYNTVEEAIQKVEKMLENDSEIQSELLKILKDPNLDAKKRSLFSSILAK